MNNHVCSAVQGIEKKKQNQERNAKLFTHIHTAKRHTDLVVGSGLITKASSVYLSSVFSLPVDLLARVAEL